MDQTLSLITRSGSAATSFTRFGSLPAELRIMIWQFAMCEGRTVALKHPHARQDEAPASLDSILPQLPPLFQPVETWSSTAQPPALLHVNSEARHEALKQYALSFAVGGAQPRVYFDFSRDTVFFSDEELKLAYKDLWARTPDLDRVQRLAIVPEGAFRALQWTKSRFASLRKLTFVHGSSADARRSGSSSFLYLLEDDEVPHHQRQEQQEQEQEQEYKPVPPDILEKTVSRQAQLRCCLDRNTVERERRRQDARDEFSTLLLVSAAQWEELPVLSTAVFKSLPES